MDTKNIKYIIFFTLLFFASSCCKKGVTTFVTDLEMISAGTFKPGTYYIYKDSITGKEDSIWVESFYKDIKLSNAEAYSKKKIDYDCEDKVEVYLLKLKNESNNSFEFQNITTIRSTTYTNLSARLLIKPFVENEIETTHYGWYKNEKFYQNYNLLSNNYSNVYNVSRKEAIYKSLQDTVLINTFYSSHTGLIKYSIKTDTSLVVKELVRSHIIK
ncbi:MAG: hypothetical protein KA275_00600 [Chitinophagaceae bacterium]|nr:hypothetical protein [Chitinophagaceae bacterium]